ncbi:MAG: DNA primase [Lentisphaerae bacterium ADurb.BinA184]|nr:MAG: DNA primase [Lentisphaerae bacterium ADurb.BinA184]
MKRERPVPLAGTPGADYLAGRGVPPELAHKAGVRFAPRWFGRPAVLFPLRNEAGELLAVNGRHTDGQAHTTDTPKTHTLGPSGQAVFAWPGALDANPAVLVEGPMCVLSLALVGVPAVAPVGTTAPRWLLRRWAFRRVFVAFDSDPETHTGDTAAAKLLAELAEFGAQGERLRPVGAKDWNDILQAGGVEALRAALAPVLAAVPAGEPLDRCPCGAEVFAFTLEGMPYCEAHAPALFAPNTAAPGTSVRCPACWRILPRGHERCPGACELREVTSCAGLPAAGPAAPFDAPAGADYEPGQDWPAEEDAPARVPGLVYLPGEEPAWCARCAVELVNLRAPDGLCGPCRWQGTKRHRVATLPPTRNPHGIQ